MNVRIETQHGDYVLGDSLLPLIWQEVITPKGGFVHLPNYGLGLSPKQIASGGNLRKLKITIEAAARRERRVRSARAVVSATQTGVVLVTLYVTYKSGERRIITGEVTDG